jgi:methyl-accepting chemotaxis protein
MKWRNISIQNKIMIISLTVILSFSLVIFFYFIPSVGDAIYETKKEKLKDIVDSSAYTIEAMYRDSKANNETDEIFQNDVIQYVSRVRYGNTGKDYLWLNDIQPVMIFHPYRSDLNGKNLSDYKDPNGKQFFLEMVNVCRVQNAGYVSYMWQYKDDASKIIPKISYVKLIPGLNWIIGTGLYEQDVKEEIQARVQSLRIKLMAAFSCITLLLIGFVFMVSHSIKKNISKCVDVVEKLAGGDLTGRVNIDQKDEIGKLASALNKTMDDMEKLISTIIAGCQNLAQAVTQISAGNQDLSQRTSEQATSIEEIASTIEETAATINQNAANSSEANSIAKSTVEAIMVINEKSGKIVDIITVINDIAFQTNLLSLNAAVEAARAGDQGRGFAVVASEVRNLAQRSGVSAREIGALIRDTVESVQNGTKMVNTVSTLVNEIALATEEQKQGINQINMAIAQMDSVTQQNASLVEETASASEELTCHAQELSEMVQVFNISRKYINDGYDDEKSVYNPEQNRQSARIKNNENSHGNGKDKNNGNGNGNGKKIGQRMDGIKGMLSIATFTQEDQPLCGKIE